MCVAEKAVESAAKTVAAREMKELTIRKARISDAAQIVALINEYARKGMMLPRSYGEVLENIRDFLVLTDGQRVLGCAALHVIWDDAAEIRSLAVADEVIGRGFGRTLVEKLLEEARELGLPQVFTLTYQEGFFAKLGFQVVDKKTLPHKFWKDCFKCVKFATCDEIAMIRDL
jgi:amino-acid N-acetyltransferase